MNIALKLTPQRSTQYTNMVEKLAAPELLASPLGQAITETKQITLAGQGYLLVTIDDALLSSLSLSQDVLFRMGATSEVYDYFASIGDLDGPFLRPIEPRVQPFVPIEIAEVRRYKGKTNEIFTRVLLNIAIFAGACSNEYETRLRILDPLAGGGTTLFLALASGYDSFGIELSKHDVETTEVFLRQYLNGEHIPYKEIDERGRRAGHRYQFEIGHKKNTRNLVLVHGNAAEANLHLQEIPGGARMHAVVGDLPYGIQHFGEIADLLRKALPVWEKLLLPGGTIALAWNATRIDRAEMVEFFEKHTALHVKNDPPYTQLAHTVDRVIKKRDIIVGVKEG